MNFLPLELLDIILQKSYLHYALNRDSFKDQSDRLLVTRLTAVDRCWFERLRKRKFRRIIWRRLSSEFKSAHIKFGFGLYSLSLGLNHPKTLCFVNKYRYALVNWLTVDGLRD